MTQAGPAIPVIAVTDRVADGGPALRVAVVSDGRPIEGGPARPVIVVADGRPTQGNEPLPVVVATGYQASQVLAGPAMAVVVVSGSGLGGSAPVNTVLPAVSGTTELGQTLTTTDGTWTGDPAPTFTYQWYRDGVAIAGATNTTYVLVQADLGTTITAEVTATNAAGATAATSAGTAITNYLLLDRFTTAQAAPLTSPRTCEPGPGVLTITDTGNKLSIVGQLLRAITQTGNADPRVATAVNLEALPGRALYCTLKLNANGDARIGFRGDTAGSATININAAGLFFDVGGSTHPAYVVGTTYELLFVLRGDWGASQNAGFGGGALGFVRGGAYASWRLIGVLNSGYVKLLSANVGSLVNTGGWDIDTLTVIDLCGPLGTLYPYATIWQGWPWELVNPTTWAITADALIECAWIPVAAETFEIRTRWTDDNNCWIVRCNQAGSTIKLIEKVASVETERATAAQTWTASTIVYRIRITQIATAFRIQVLDGTSALLTYASASFQQTATGLVFTGGTKVRDGVAWPILWPSIDLTTTAALPIRFLAYGDSKTYGTGDTTPPAASKNGYPPILCDSATTATRGAWEYPARIGVGGRTTATAKAAIDAELAALTNTPDNVLYNLGANDINLAMGQAAWQTNTLYIWDAMHVKWPNVPIYVMKVWVRGQNANCDTYDDTWLPTAVALRSSFVFLHAALDERVILEAGDDGVTYTTDGIHPNRAGYVRTATAWQTALGL